MKMLVLSGRCGTGARALVASFIGSSSPRDMCTVTQRMQPRDRGEHPVCLTAWRDSRPAHLLTREHVGAGGAAAGSFSAVASVRRRTEHGDVPSIRVLSGGIALAVVAVALALPA